MDRQSVEERDRQFDDDVGLRDLKFAMWGIPIVVGLVILLAIIA